MRTFIVSEIGWDNEDIDEITQHDEQEASRLYDELPTSIVVGLDDDAAEADVERLLMEAVERQEGISVNAIDWLEPEFDIEPKIHYQSLSIPMSNAA